jgi:hypothetical protein
VSAEETLAMIARCDRHQYPEFYGGQAVPCPTWYELEALGRTPDEPALQGFNQEGYVAPEVGSEVPG